MSGPVKLLSDDLNLIGKVEKGVLNNKLEREFKRMRGRMLQEGRELSADGAWARAMLAFVPALIAYLKRERRAQISPYDTIDGLANALAEIIVQTIDQRVLAPERRKAFEVIIAHLNDQAGPRIQRTQGGILLPPGGHA